MSLSVCNPERQRFSSNSVSVFVFYSGSAVNAAVFTAGDIILSASDDQTVKVWDMRNFTVYRKKISTDSCVNRWVGPGSGKQAGDFGIEYVSKSKVSDKFVY